MKIVKYEFYHHVHMFFDLSFYIQFLNLEKNLDLSVFDFSYLCSLFLLFDHNLPSHVLPLLSLNQILEYNLFVYLQLLCFVLNNLFVLVQDHVFLQNYHLYQTHLRKVKKYQLLLFEK